MIKQCKTRLDHEFAMFGSDVLCSVHYLFMTHKENVTDVKFIFKLSLKVFSQVPFEGYISEYVCLNLFTCNGTASLFMNHFDSDLT